MTDYNNKLVEFQPASANRGAGYLIRNGGTKEEVYLKSVQREMVREILSEYEFHLPKGRPPRKKPGRKPAEPKEDSPTATWTADETQAMYFSSLRDAEKMIEKWPILRKAQATIVKG